MEKRLPDYKKIYNDIIVKKCPEKKENCQAIMMKKNYNKLVGKNKKEILEIVKEDQFNDPYSDEWFFYLKKSNLWKKKYLYLLFEEDIVVQSSIIYKFFWIKKY